MLDTASEQHLKSIAVESAVKALMKLALKVSEKCGVHEI